MSSADTVSRPYAQAIFEIAVQNNSIEEWKNILIFIKTIASHKKVKSFLSGSLSPKYLSLAFITISKDIINENVKNLIKLLAEYKRLGILDNIFKNFLKLEAHYNNFMIIELQSAFSLKEKEIIQIKKMFEKFFLKKIKFIRKVNPCIINGMIIKINNTVFDLSTQNHLKQLSDVLNF